MKKLMIMSLTVAALCAAAPIGVADYFPHPVPGAPATIPGSPFGNPSVPMVPNLINPHFHHSPLHPGLPPHIPQPPVPHNFIPYYTYPDQAALYAEETEEPPLAQPGPANGHGNDKDKKKDDDETKELPMSFPPFPTYAPQEYFGAPYRYWQPGYPGFSAYTDYGYGQYYGVGR